MMAGSIYAYIPLNNTVTQIMVQLYTVKRDYSAVTSSDSLVSLVKFSFSSLSGSRPPLDFCQA